SVLALAGAAHAATPRRGGRLRVASATASIADTLDPAKQSNQTDYVRGCMLYNGLTALDGRLDPQPALAERFDSDDARTWVFKLRRGVVFHDGRPLRPQDVVYSLLRHKDPATVSKARLLADQIESVRASGADEVTVRLHRPNADLPVLLGTFHFHIVPDGTTDFSRGIGTGPYRLKEFKRGLRSIVVRNPHYWKPGRPYLDEIEFSGLGDESARVNALLSGDLDLVASIDPRSVARVRATPGYQMFVTPSGQYTNLAMRTDMEPGRRRDVVLALKYLFDRRQMREAIALGQAVIGNDQPIDPNNRFWCAELPQRHYDPDLARHHFKRSGLGGAPIPVVASPAATYSVEMALTLQQAARRIGMNLQVRRMPADGYWSNHWGKSAVGFGNVNQRPNADSVLTQFFKSDAPWNDAHWHNARFDQLLLAARSELDVARRKQMYSDMQALIHAQGGVAIPLFLSSLDAHTSRLKGLSPIPLGGLMGYAFAEHVWLEDP
ncbi:ABC transporter substrate-binding protein, partial [Xanthomonas campestris pv. cannae]|nr:ABC transporter substrate-binding protein [Xanthomonas campestris pv. cannae]